MDEIKDPRFDKSERCRAKIETATGIWECIKKPHAKVYYRRRTGQSIYNNNPGVDAHYFVKKQYRELPED